MENPFFRMCGETVQHIICECEKLAQGEYKRRHDTVAKLVHWKLYKTQRTQTSLRRLQDILKRSRRPTTKQDVIMTSGKSVGFTTSWRRLIYAVLKTSNLRRLEDVWFTTSSGRLVYNLLKTSDLRNLEDVWFGTCWKRLIYKVFRTSDLGRLDDVQFTLSWRRPIYDVLKTSVKRRLCSNVVATSIKRRKKLFFLILYCLKYSENFKFSSLG